MGGCLKMAPYFILWIAVNSHHIVFEVHIDKKI